MDWAAGMRASQEQQRAMAAEWLVCVFAVENDGCPSCLLHAYNANSLLFTFIPSNFIVCHSGSSENQSDTWNFNLSHTMEKIWRQTTSDLFAVR
jgi:hypothetical protein